MTQKQDLQAIRSWLQSEPPLQELCQRFPDEWQVVEEELTQALSSGKPTDVQNYVKKRSQLCSLAGVNPHDHKRLQQVLADTVCYQMARKAVQRHYVAIASGVENGTVRFNLLNGLIAQKLLFAHDLVRKPASLFWFRLLWPLVWQKRFLMPLVQPKGIYCFYSRELVRELAKIIGGRNCLEIAAGDGTLSRFMNQAGENCTATDDYSWQHAVTYPDEVVRCDAVEALRRYLPEVVICSWPPAGNKFEKQIFVTKSVQHYIMIGSRHTFAAGNWDAYKNQSAFNFEEVARLSAMLLPPELDAAVYLFTRKQS